jgi:hypothetical protein
MTRRTSWRGLSRRSFFKGLGLSAGLAPFVPILNASGQEPRRPKRLLLLFTPDGTADSDGAEGAIDWKPQGTESDFTLHQIHAPLAPLKSKLVVPWGLQMSAAGAGEQHAFGAAGCFTGARLKDPGNGADFDGGNGHRTGWGSGPSVDQIVAAASGENMPYARPPEDPNQETPYRSLELGVQCANPSSVTRIIYKGDDQPLHPEVNPQALFDRLFADLMPPSGDSDAAAMAAAQHRLEQESLLALLRGDLAKLRTRVSSEEYPKIEAHLDGLRAIEQRLGSSDPPVGGGGCSAPTRPDPSDRFANNAKFPVEVDVMLGMIPHIFACDLTRVASVQLSCGFSNVTHTWLGHDTAHHIMSHENADNRDKLMAIDAWYAERIFAMLQALDAIDEGDGTLLDNTLIVWARELGTTSHSMRPWPVVMFGGAPVGLRGGRFIDAGDQKGAALLVSVCQMMGLETNSVGNLDMDTGPLDGLA